MFAVGGLQQVQEPTPRAERARAIGLPVSDDLVRTSGAAMMLAALGLQIRPVRRAAALLLALQLPPITYIGHAFWKLEPGQQRNTNKIQFFKNLTMIGGALYIALTPDR
jgi:uncharacterized membrane protein YphA (DoxX/SURF4 family)